MPRSKIQFQKGLSLPQFIDQYGTEDQCFDALFQWRWPNGFICPHCQYTKYCQLTVRKLLQCHRCTRQTSITAGTLFDSTKLPLRTWFLGLYFMTQEKKGVSAMALHRKLNISYNAAWRMKQKLMQAMAESERNRTLSGWIELDDAYLGGERTGGKRGRGAQGKTPFVAAVETTACGNPLTLKLSIVPGFRFQALKAWSQRYLRPGSSVVSDGLACFSAVTQAGCQHRVIMAPDGLCSVDLPEFYWVNTLLGNIKNALRGTYHAVRPRYAQRYLSEFEYRFNRRWDLAAMLPSLARTALNTPPIPERLLKIGLG